MQLKLRKTDLINWTTFFSVLNMQESQLRVSPASLDLARNKAASLLGLSVEQLDRLCGLSHASPDRHVALSCSRTAGPDERNSGVDTNDQIDRLRVSVNRWYSLLNPALEAVSDGYLNYPFFTTCTSNECSGRGTAETPWMERERPVLLVLELGVSWHHRRFQWAGCGSESGNTTEATLWLFCSDMVNPLDYRRTTLLAIFFYFEVVKLDDLHNETLLGQARDCISEIETQFF